MAVNQTTLGAPKFFWKRKVGPSRQECYFRGKFSEMLQRKKCDSRGHTRYFATWIKNVTKAVKRTGLRLSFCKLT